ncbi:DUF7144 family membrane protein [Mycetocola zhadangensis]|uniref:DUF7144 domain-containing protein n=1 Tax=Mycetocola zhadangensis TaxID=1164595 RepID=A0A3L7J6W5_9MICO|nr:hypothetical protein [Mycetocola zhadangensis]RLQ86366.1 hypothetical protein D9V28_05990 [Mycetocola zhadangensis]GGE90596.1 hypothetical protein GCM10011313_11840 [Mycetocola zhadangensis]
MSISTTEARARSGVWAGWVTFAGVILMINGIFSVIQGVVALIGPDTYYAAMPSGLFLFDVEGWGWFNLIVGVLLIATAIGVFAEQGWARITAIVLAVVSALIQLLLMPAQPWWSLIVIAIDITIIYALVVRSDESLERR